MRNTWFGILTSFLIGAVIAATFVYLGNRRSEINRDPSHEYPQRIICAVPNITEIVFALGQGDRVVGVSDFVTYPPEALAKESIGGYIDPNFERIIALEPDLVIVIGINNRLISLCEEKGIGLLRVEIEDIDSLFAGIETIAQTLGVEDEAKKLMDEMQSGLQAIKKKASTVEGNPDVFICLSRMEGELTDLFTVSDDTFLGELVTLAGGKNVFGDVGSRYPQIAKESLMKREPEIIIELRPEDILTTRSIAEIKSDWNEISIVPAVAAGKIHIVTDDYIKIAGPRIVQSAERLYSILHHD